MSPEDFANAIRKGLGRAALTIPSSVNQDYKEVILNACKEDQRFDGSFEDARTEYLMHLVERAGLCEELRSILLEQPEKIDGRQRLRLLAYYACKQDHDALALLQKEAKQGNLEATNVLMDFGFLPWVIENILPEVPASEKWRFRLQEEEYLALTTDQIQKLKEAEAEFEATVDRPSKGIDPKQTSIQTLFEQVKESEQYAPSLSRIGPNLSDDQVQEIAELWLSETNRRKGNNFAKLFEVRDFPFPVSRIIDLVRNGLPPIQFEKVLSYEEDPLVREFGLELIASGDYRGYITLASSWEDQDFDMMTSSLRKFESADAQIIHGLCTNLLNIAGDWTPVERQPFLIWVYETSPCAFCRNGAATRMVQDGTLPEFYWEELQFDSEGATRELFANRISLSGSPSQ